LRVEDGEAVQLSSRRGTIQLPARISPSVSPGLVFLPFHWGDLFAPRNAANYLTIAATDATSKQPELKFCAVSVEKIHPINGKSKTLISEASEASAFGLPPNRSLRVLT
jgi:predicted molibdopterin-dependent oxidoreductase YjgC